MILPSFCITHTSTGSPRIIGVTTAEKRESGLMRRLTEPINSPSVEKTGYSISTASKPSTARNDLAHYRLLKLSECGLSVPVCLYQIPQISDIPPGSTVTIRPFRSTVAQSTAYGTDPAQVVQDILASGPSNPVPERSFDAVEIAVSILLECHADLLLQFGKNRRHVAFPGTLLYDTHGIYPARQL